MNARSLQFVSVIFNKKVFLVVKELSLDPPEVKPPDTRIGSRYRANHGGSLPWLSVRSG